MEEVYIVDAARSPIGKFMGSLSEFTSPQIGSLVVKGMLSRTKVAPKLIDNAIVGNALPAGLGQNPAKQVVVYSGLPNEISTFNINMVCASGMKAIALGAEAITAGNADVVLAGGIESMTNTPHTVRGVRKLKKFGNVGLKEFADYAKSPGEGLEETELVDDVLYSGLMDHFSHAHMGALAEDIGVKCGISRQEQDAFALESHRKAAAAADTGKFKREIIPIELKSGSVFASDEGIRRDTSMEKLAKLAPSFKEGGTITAGNSSQLSDGASFMILMSEAKAKSLGLKPLAVVESYADSGSDPSWYGLAPTTATEKALRKSGHTLEEIDLIEINEAFCVQVLGVAKELGMDKSKLDVNGGATALGHPIGASGARILTTLIYALADRNKKLGLATLCHGGGGASTMVVKRI